jgi:hypothetical protein
MKNISKFIIGLFIAIGLFSCEDFGDMNDNPNAPLSIENNPELILTNLCYDPVNNLVNTGWSDANLMAQYAARIVFTSFDQFEWGSNSGTWNELYTSIRNANNLQQIGIEKENKSYEAIALILKSWMFQILTDMWGDVPYSDAIKGKSDENFKPAYDSQEDIYTGILADLESANQLLSASDAPNVSGDLIFDGDVTQWRKFANSLKLRVLMRMSNVKPSLVETEIANIVNNPSAYPIIASNDDNVTLHYLASFPNTHPRAEASGYRVGSFNEYRMSETIEKVLKAYNDPRLSNWFAPTSNSVTAGTPEWAGMANGLVDGTAYIYKGGDAFLSKFADKFYFEPNTIEALLMTYAEVEFILAEAAQRYASIDNAQDHYENGIAASFEYWGESLPSDYLTRTSNDAEWTVPVAYEGNLETIITQKWLALLYTDYQGFCEFKRTGYPSVIKPGPDAFLPVYPSRFVYPDEEQSLNAASRNAAISRQGEDAISTKVWWEGN